MNRIAQAAIARPVAILIGALLVLIVFGALGSTVLKSLKSGGFVTDDMESVQVDKFMVQNFPDGDPNYIVLVRSDAGPDAPATAAAGKGVVAELRKRPEVAGVQAYWDLNPTLAPAFLSRDKKSAVVLVQLRGNDSEGQDAAGRISEEISGEKNGVSVKAGGLASATYDINHKSSEDLVKAEALAVPLSGIALVIIFGSVVAAMLPVLIGVFTVAVTLGILKILTMFTDVSVFAMNMASALSLALAIDYSLFIVSRFREELDKGSSVSEAVIAANRTAGRTVVFSALAVVISLLGLLAFKPFFFKSFSYAGIAVVAAAALAAVVVLPAALSVLGTRVNRYDVRPFLRRTFRLPPKREVAPRDSRWYRSVVFVMRHATPLALLAVVVLCILGAPFLSAQFGYPDDRALPTSVDSRQVGDSLRTDFSANFAATVTIALPGYDGTGAALAEYGQRLSRVDGVSAVLSGDGVFADGVRVAASPTTMMGRGGAYATAFSTVDPFSQTGKDQLTALRDVSAPSPPIFGGTAATNENAAESLVDRLPWAIVIIAASTFVVLFLFTGSLVLPLKALVLNILSLFATFGAMVWMFQDGNLSGLVGFTAPGYLNMAVPILMFCLAFGISMDYEVFLLSRIREEWFASDRSPEANVHSVAMGVARTGRIFTAAAVLMAIVFLCLATSSVSSTQLFGIGLALAVLADATLIRLILVPAVMKLMSRVNWWAPKPLARVHDRLGLRETAE